jgi:DNA-binding transcriptional ArsR family regulator
MKHDLDAHVAGDVVGTVGSGDVTRAGGKDAVRDSGSAVRSGGGAARNGGSAVRGSGSELAGLLQALGDPVRLRVVEALSRSPERAGDLAVAAGVPAATMSKHLRALLSAGVVVDERDVRDARVRVFRLRRESVGAVRAWLDQLQAHWDEQLRAFGAYVERAHGERDSDERGLAERARAERDSAERESGG